MKRASQITIFIAAVFATLGCGQVGELYLPQATPADGSVEAGVPQSAAAEHNSELELEAAVPISPDKEK